MGWTVLAPLLRLGLYTFVFAVVLHVRWPGPPRSSFETALLYFTGLTLFDFFFDCITAAPALIVDYANFVKKVVFPLEILAFVVVGAALVRFVITSCVLLAFYLAIDGVCPDLRWFVAVPKLILLPLVLVALGTGLDSGDDGGLCPRSAAIDIAVCDCRDVSEPDFLSGLASARLCAAGVLCQSADLRDR